MKVGDQAYLVLSEDFESVIRANSGWYPNSVLLRKIQHLKASNIERVRCSILDVDSDSGDVEVICEELDGSMRDPINVHIWDLE